MKILDSEKFLTYKQVASRLGMSVRQVYRIVESGQLPRPVKISNRSKRFPESEISAFISELKNKRGNF